MSVDLGWTPDFSVGSTQTVQVHPWARQAIVQSQASPSAYVSQALQQSIRAEREAFVYDAVRSHAVAQELRSLSPTLSDFTPSPAQTFWSDYVAHSPLAQGAVATYDHVGGLVNDAAVNGIGPETFRASAAFSLGVSQAYVPARAGSFVQAGVSRLGQAIDPQSFQRGVTAEPFMTTVGSFGAPLAVPRVAPLAVRPVAPTSTVSQLNILNPQFTPNGARVLQNVTNQVNAEFSSNLRLANTVLSRGQLDAAAASRGVARMQYGNAVERLVRDRVQADPLLDSLYRHVGGAGNPDFVGRGLFQGMNFDITTPGQVSSHLARPGYGAGLNVITYQRPAGFP